VAWVQEMKRGVSVQVELIYVDLSCVIFCADAKGNDAWHVVDFDRYEKGRFRE